MFVVFLEFLLIYFIFIHYLSRDNFCVVTHFCYQDFKLINYLFIIYLFVLQSHYIFSLFFSKNTNIRKSCLLPTISGLLPVSWEKASCSVSETAISWWVPGLVTADELSQSISILGCPVLFQANIPLWSWYYHFLALPLQEHFLLLLALLDRLTLFVCFSNCLSLLFFLERNTC